MGARRIGKSRRSPPPPEKYIKIGFTCGVGVPYWGRGGGGCFFVFIFREAIRLCSRVLLKHKIIYY